MLKHDDFMKLALNEAKKCSRKKEIPVGAIIVDEFQNIISKGYNKVEEKNKMDFVKSLQKYWPSIKESNLSPNYSGIRAKEKGAEDFGLEKIDKSNKIAINILGYISPGLTSSLALGEKIMSLIKD